MLINVIRMLLKVVLRPSAVKLSKEMQRVGEEIWEQILLHDISPKHIERAITHRREVFRTEGANEIVGEIAVYYSTLFSTLIHNRGILIRASLLPVQEYWDFLDEKKIVQDKVFGSLSQIMMLKLINGMAEVDFDRTFGLTRAEWDEQRPDRDKIDETIEAIRDKKPLPAEVQEILKEVDGIVPFNFDYDTIN